MELKGKKVLVFGAGKSGIGAADLLNAVGACPVLYDGKADLDKESVLHKISGNYELPIYAGELPKEVQESLDLVVLSPGVPTDLPIVKGFYDQKLPVWGEPPVIEPRLDLRAQLLIAHQKSQNRQAQRIKPAPLREIIQAVSLEVFIVCPG